QQERHEEEQWRVFVGMDAARQPGIATPGDFTARVMARIETLEAQSASPLSLSTSLPAQAVHPAFPALGPIRVVAGTIGISAMMALISSCVLAILAPAQALPLLGAALSAGVVLLTLVRAGLGLTGSGASGAALLLLLTLVPLVVLIAAGRTAWQSGRV